MPASAFPKYEKNEESTYHDDPWEDESGDAEEVIIINIFINL